MPSVQVKTVRYVIHHTANSDPWKAMVQVHWDFASREQALAVAHVMLDNGVNGVRIDSVEQIDWVWQDEPVNAEAQTTGK